MRHSRFHHELHHGAQAHEPGNRFSDHLFDRLHHLLSREHRSGRFENAVSLHGVRHAIGRHGHRNGGGGPFWGARGERGFGDDDGFTRGRKFTSDDLQLMLLALIEEAPRHGYELIKALEARSNGFYAPSPGMVYPALTYLEELGYVSVQQEGNRKRYELTEAGRAYLDANRDKVDVILAKLSFVASKMESMRRAYAAGDDSVAFDGDSRWHPKLQQARYTLKLALVRHVDAGEAEQRRIAEILLRAAAEIEGTATGPAANKAPA